MGVITVIGEHGEAVAQGRSGNQQVNRVNPSSLAAVDQVRLDLPRHDTSPMVQFNPDVGLSELAKVHSMLILRRTAADLHFRWRADPHQAALKIITPRTSQHRAAINAPVGAGVNQVLPTCHRSPARSAASRSAISARLRATLAALAAALATSVRSVSSRLLVPSSPAAAVSSSSSTSTVTVVVTRTSLSLLLLPRLPAG
jgi:hypothetical protein